MDSNKINSFDYELSLIQSASDSLTELSFLIDNLSDRLIDDYRHNIDYFDNIKHMCKKIVGGLDRLEDRLSRIDREEILNLLQK